MDDELLARLAALVGVMAAGEEERLDDAVAVDRHRGLVGVLLDDREQVGEQPLLGRGEVGRADGGAGAVLAAGADGRARLDERRGSVGVGGQAARALARLSHRPCLLEAVAVRAVRRRALELGVLARRAAARPPVARVELDEPELDEHAQQTPGVDGGALGGRPARAGRRSSGAPGASRSAA